MPHLFTTRIRTLVDGVWVSDPPRCSWCGRQGDIEAASKRDGAA